MSDSSLQRDVMRALADNQLVFPDEISAQVVGNDVTLRGTVGSVQQRDEAGRSTFWVSGVRHVDNQLRVRVLDSDRRADADTQAAVMDALSADPGLHEAPLDAIATAGSVTLRGVVATRDLRGKAAQIAFDTPGVSEVHNKIESAS